eukprot:TRINITY_DN1696_c0_g1::TRINITY_DN1696_c0_g1_i1::g.17667::m.17667 TRINITY_DN1696_c0_g1::TRINITY_DN1696_c0_g1_i1::g.17667  ORF type:complete len:198 (+),score=26.66,AcylCoA_DH_N/PF12418.3/0.019,Yae1_N/PF09811.4/0.25 TRINITY_DN1696_c0_g1_i1:55-594(+)
MDFVLDDVLELENQFSQHGFDEGTKAGSTLAVRQGEAIGFTNGLLISGEVGYYRGVIETLKAMSKTGCWNLDSSIRLRKTFDSFSDLVEKVQLKLQHTSAQDRRALSETQNQVSEAQEDFQSQCESIGGDDDLSSHVLDPELDVVSLLNNLRSKFRLTMSLLGLSQHKLEFHTTPVLQF